MDTWQAIHSRRLQERRCLGRAVREARARRGLSQEALGFRAGLHRNFVGAIERGETNPTFATLLNVVSGLDLALSAVIELYERHVAEAC
jgi:transcriptional regulator with XRE-family HTH domain